MGHGRPAGRSHPALPPHLLSESFFILSGTVRLFDGRRWIDAVPGDFMFVPEGGVHAFGHECAEPASMLILFTPGAPREGFFEALSAIAAEDRQPTGDEWADLYRRHDTYPV